MPLRYVDENKSRNQSIKKRGRGKQELDSMNVSMYEDYSRVISASGELTFKEKAFFRGTTIGPTYLWHLISFWSGLERRIMAGESSGADVWTLPQQRDCYHNRLGDRRPCRDP